MFRICFCVFFFFKQKTAYEMRISDWSSDVCSSDLFGVQEAFKQQVVAYWVEVGNAQRESHQGTRARAAPRPHRHAIALAPVDEIGHDKKIARKTDRKSVG